MSSKSHSNMSLQATFQELPQTNTESSTQTAFPTSEQQERASTLCDTSTISDKLEPNKTEEDTEDSPTPQSEKGTLHNEDGRPDAEKAEKTSDHQALSQTRKNILLSMFSLAMFIDIWMYSAFFIFTDVIATDLHIEFAQQSWAITAYSVTFAAFLLFWGRVADLYSAKPVFTYNISILGVLSLVISFLPEQYSFFVLRAISGIAGAALIPSAYRLIMEVFAPHELGRAFTLFGMAGALANVSGVIVAGLIDLVKSKGQGESWRWFFRLVAVMIAPLAVLAFILIPKRRGMDAECQTAKWKRLDLPGALLMLSAIILLILSLTLGASEGFRSAAFLVPFLISLVLLAPAFFVWEARVPTEIALLPPSFWRIPNVALLVVFATQVYPWWGVNFLAHVEVWTKIHHESGLLAAVRCLPQGISAFIVVLLLTFIPILVSRPRWTVIVGNICTILGYVLFVLDKEFVGADYWRWVFTGSIIGSSGMAAVFTATNVALMTSVDPQMAGVAGAMLQVAFQVGAAVGFGAQAGLFTVNEGGIANMDNVHASFYFQLGWTALWLIIFVVFYRQPKEAAGGTAAAH